MKKNFNFFFLSFIFIFLSQISFAENKVSFIDIEYIYSNSTVGKKIIDQLNKETDKINDEISNYQKKIKIEKNNLINQKNIISEEEFRKRSTDLDKNINEYNRIISNKNNEFKKYKNEAKNLFFKELVIIVQNYAKDNSIELIIKKENIIIGMNNLDITNDILNLLNKKIKNITLK